MGEIDGLSLISIDFYVSALTPQLHESEAALELSENITFLTISATETCVISKVHKVDTWGLRGILYI
jgi:hypothetical protein